MEYLALDIETTGLNLEKSQVLQIAAIHVSSKGKKTFNMFVDNGPITYWEPIALSMNKNTFEQIIKQGIKTLCHQAYAQWEIFLRDRLKVTGAKNLVVAGKNAAGFDIPILRNNGFSVGKFSHRVLDVGSLYLPDFGYIPNLSEINTKLGRKPVSHNALEDCEDVVAAIEAKLKK